MQDEDQRFKTFVGNWSPSYHKTPLELAQNGFYCIGEGDRVKCAFCGVVLHKWEKDDDIFTDHLRSSPYCSFVQEILQSNSDIGYRKLTNVKYPQYDTAETRLASFVNWPIAAVQTPRELTWAGFFYTGQADKVKCYVCGGNLKDWDPSDVPIHEHTKWYPDCDFVKTYKENHERGSAGASYQSSAARPRETGVSVAVSKQQPEDDINASVKARMDTARIQTLLQRGLAKRESVEKAIKKQLALTGDDFPNLESLMEAVDEIENDIYSAENKGYEEPVVNVVSVEAEENIYSGHRGGALSGQKETVHSATYDHGNTNYRDPIYLDKYKYPLTSIQPEVKVRSRGVNLSEVEFAGSDMLSGSWHMQNSPVTEIQQQGAGASTFTTGHQQDRPSDEDYKSLKESYEQLKDDRTCKICMENPCDVVFLPCGHMVACTACAYHLRLCPICRRAIENTIKTYVS